MEFLKPNWRVPEHIQAFSSTRVGGHSEGQYLGLNLGIHVGDDSRTVERNRRELTTCAGW